MADAQHHADGGPVVLDIGADVGALVVYVPPNMYGAEIEICPAGEAHDAMPREHVGVHTRGGLPTAVFPTVHEGQYELYRRPDGAAVVMADAVGGEVREVHWPPEQ